MNGRDPGWRLTFLRSSLTCTCTRNVLCNTDVNVYQKRRQVPRRNTNDRASQPVDDRRSPIVVIRRCRSLDNYYGPRLRGDHQVW